MRVSGEVGLEVVPLLSKNCRYSWEERLDLVDAAGRNGSGSSLLQYLSESAFTNIDVSWCGLSAKGFLTQARESRPVSLAEVDEGAVVSHLD